MGELLIQVLAAGGEEPPFSLPGLPVTWPHAEIAEGWGGDRLNMYEDADGAGSSTGRRRGTRTPMPIEFETRVSELAVDVRRRQHRSLATGRSPRDDRLSDQATLDSTSAAL